VVNEIDTPLSTRELDSVYDLPFTKMPHPKYKKRGPIKAYEMIKNSINTHRGCFGGCSFCAITRHQGKTIISRSEKSIIDEVKKLTVLPEFKGTISDVGGPSANMYKMGGGLDVCNKCKRDSCLHPRICKHLNTSHESINNLLNKISNLEGVKHVFISSGVRYDLFYQNPSIDKEIYKRNLIVKHTSGKLKVAPEHSEDHVLSLMNKSEFSYFEQFFIDFKKIKMDTGGRQLLALYLMSSHPGCSNNDMLQLSKKMKKMGLTVDQVQDFTPTPMTKSTVMFYTSINPDTGESIEVEKDLVKKRKQKDIFFKF